MHTQKFSHMVGGKILEVIMVISAIALLVLFLMFLFADALDVIPMLILLVSVISVIWFTCKYYKPAFTNVIFSDEGTYEGAPVAHADMG